MRELKVLIACEFSGTVRNAFLEEGHDAWSCDLLPSLDGSNRHIRDDIRNVLKMERWDLLMVAHPPCTRLCNSGSRWLTKPPKRLKEEHAEPYTPEEMAAYEAMTPEQRRAFFWGKLDKGAALFSDLWNADVPHLAVENPIMHKHAKAKIRNYKNAAQYVQPWQFGDNETKATGLWLRNLPALTPLVRKRPEGCIARVHKATPGKDRWKERSKFFPGIAREMARQWGAHIARTMAPQITVHGNPQLDLFAA